MPQPDRGPGGDGAEFCSRYCVTPKRLLQRLDRSGQDVGDHGGRERIPVVWCITPSDTRWIDRHDEIASCGQVPGHAEGTFLTRDVEVEVLTAHPATRDAHPEQRPRTKVLGHEDVGGNPGTACRRDGSDVHVDGRPAHAHARNACRRSSNQSGSLHGLSPTDSRRVWRSQRE
jgi:hypothetical protein